MPARKRPAVRIAGGSGWTLATTTGRGQRRGAAAQSPLLESVASTERVVLEAQYEATRTPRRGAADEPLVLELEAADENYVIAAQHESGAVTFHPPVFARQRRTTAARRATGPVRLQFRIAARGSVSPDTGRRSGVVKKVIKFVVVKLLGKVAELALVKLARKWEEQQWKKHTRGLVHVDPTTLALGNAGSLKPLKDLSKIAAPPARNLLLLHGTFSKAESGFAGLARTVSPDGAHFFDAVRDLYGDRVFAFNHFTVSESPEENARALLKALPKSGGVFDVITHSRGGLVLRTLVERQADLGGDAARFRLGRAILCAGPNEGTPLADGDRWDTITTWIGNLTDLFPDNPFTFAVDFLAESLKWLARATTEKLPGLASMNPNGDVIAALQDDPGPPANAYWTVAANHEPTDTLLQRAADVGLDALFARANDMVVPTAGSWRVSPAQPAVIPALQIACFGPGGNVASNANGDVHHCNIFSQPETIDVLLHVLRDQPIGLPPLDPATEPPTFGLLGPRRSLRAIRPTSPLPALPVSAAVAATAVPSFPVPSVATTGAVTGAPVVGAVAGAPEAPRAQLVTTVDSRGRASAFFAPIEPPADENFNLFLFAPQTSTEEAGGYYLLASFRNARVLVPFLTRGDENGKRWERIIEMRRHIAGYIEGLAKYPKLPTDPELRQLGRDLFDVLFPGDIRRLYDHARAEFARPIGAQIAERRLSIIFTSTVGWVADKPWEFAYDPSRRALLAAQDINFVRNVLTAVPAEARLPRADKLRVLVVAAQPVGAAALSVDEEIAVIGRGFQPLIDAQLAEVQIVPSVTPERLHELMQSSAYGNDPIDVLHFIGHGEYRESEQTGYLLFENENGGVQEVDAEIITQIVARRGIRLVFFNACETGTGYSGALDFASGVAPSLVAAGVPAVVANQFPVLDPSATAFARHLYWSLAHGRSIGDAAREARVAVNYSITGEAIDWAVPVVFARNPYESLVVAPASASTAPTQDAVRKAVRQTRRRGTRSKSAAVALWDVNHSVPNLERLIARMNGAQDYFRFELADITAPIGTWRRLPLEIKPTSNTQAVRGSEGHLYAAEVFEKLKGVPAQLGVHELICFTNFGLSDDEDINLEGLQSPDQSITIVSTAGVLDALNPPATSIERLVVNQVAAYINPVDPHGSGVKRCPNFYNRKRDLEITAGRIALCKACRRKLARAEDGAAILRAVDSLLAMDL